MEAGALMATGVNVFLCEEPGSLPPLTGQSGPSATAHTELR